MSRQACPRPVAAGLVGGLLAAGLQRSSVGLLVALTVVFSGCASNCYTYGVGANECAHPLSASAHNCVQMGQSHPRLDRCEQWLADTFRPMRDMAGVSTPDVCDAATNCGQQQSIEEVQSYLAANGIHDVDVAVRCYQPEQQWQRLRANQDISPLWKYTFGTANWLKYKYFPGRVFRYDDYDPFTNTLHLNSAKPERALYEAAEVKQFQKQRFPGFYAASQRVPFLPVFHHWATAEDVLTYSKFSADCQSQEQLYPVAHRQVVAAAASGALSFVPSGSLPVYAAPLVNVAAQAVGNTSGKVASRYSGN